VLNYLLLEFVRISPTGSGSRQAQLCRINVTEVGWHVLRIRYPVMGLKKPTHAGKDIVTRIDAIRVVGRL
jgi:hypothetical protein